MLFTLLFLIFHQITIGYKFNDITLMYTALE